MKKINFAIAIMVFVPGLLLGQESYFRFSLGYGFPASSHLIGTNSTYNSGTSSSSSTEQGVYGSFGSGVTFNASYGQMFSKNLGMDIGIQYLWGKTYSDTYSSSTSSSNASMYANGLLLTPSLVMTVGEGKVVPYLKAGFCVGLITAKEQTANKTSFGTSPQTVEIVREYSGGLSMGFRGSIGLDFRAAKGINFFTEIMLTSMSYYPNQSEVTSYKVNGVDQPSQHLKTTYKESVTSSSTSGTTSEALQVSMPLDNISLNAGIRVRLKSKA
jgi:hypothetical protein